MNFETIHAKCVNCGLVSTEVEHYKGGYWCIYCKKQDEDKDNSQWIPEAYQEFHNLWDDHID